VPAPDEVSPWLGVAVAVVLLLLVLSVPGAKTVRRARRRRDRSPRRAVLGAGWETIDRMREAGLPTGPALTTGQVVALTDIPEVSTLASLVDRAAYAPEDVPAGLPLQAWTTAAGVRRRLRSRMRLRRRVGAFLDPRPLLRRQGYRRS
jgi:hypothetical protein